MTKQIVLIVLVLSLTSCFTPRNPKDEPIVTEQMAYLDPRGSGEIPSSLWSPLRRQLKARHYFLIAEYEALRGNFKKSQRFFELAYSLDSNPFLAIKMIEAQASIGKVEEAIILCQKMVLLAPKNAEINRLYAQLLASQGLYQQAEVYYQKAIGIDSENTDAYIGLIDVYRAQKNISQAIVIAEELVEKRQSYTEGWSLLAKLLLSTKQKARALKPAAIAYEMKSQDPEKVLIYALALELNNQSKKAVKLYEILFRMNPTNEELIARMVDLYRQIGDLNDALDLLQEVVKNFDDVGPGLKMQQAFILWELKRYKEASDLLDYLANKFPESDRLLYLAALGQERVLDFDRALDTFQKIPSASTYKIHAEFRSVGILQALKRYEEALEICRRTVKSGLERAVDFYGIGAAILSEQDREQDAVDFLREGIKLFPNDVSLLFFLGVYEEKAGNRVRCIEIMRQVIEKQPENSSALNFLGYLFAENGENLDEAELLIKKALKIKPDDGYYADSLGWVYFQKGELDKALDWLIKANKTNPNEGVILEHLGDVYLLKGDKATALDFYKRAVKGNLEKRDAPRINEKLRRFEKDHKN